MVFPITGMTCEPSLEFSLDVMEVDPVSWFGEQSHTTGEVNCVFLSGRVNSENYQRVLETHLLPVYNAGDTFQQDNAPPHVSKSTRKWLTDHNLSILEWPSVSPDLNPIENVWSLLARAVYQDGKQFSSITELKEAITKEWHKLPQSTLKNLISSMDDCVYKINVGPIHRKGACVSKI